MGLCDCYVYFWDYLWVRTNTKMEYRSECSAGGGYSTWYDCECKLCGRKFEYQGN